MFSLRGETETSDVATRKIMNGVWMNRQSSAYVYVKLHGLHISGTRL